MHVDGTVCTFGEQLQQLHEVGPEGVRAGDIVHASVGQVGEPVLLHSQAYE